MKHILTEEKKVISYLPVSQAPQAAEREQQYGLIEQH
jgi:hypothetical protein